MGVVEEMEAVLSKLIKARDRVMDSPSIVESTGKRLSRGDMFAGVGVSIVGHILIFSLAVALPWSLSKQSPLGSAYTVNLVSLQDIGFDAAPPKKGIAAGVDGGKAESSRKSSAPTREKASPVVPIKRLRIDEPSVKPAPEIKKIEAPELPKPVEKPQNVASVEKDLDKLIPKPKIAPKPAPITQEKSQPTSTAKGSPASSQEEKTSARASSGASDGVAKSASGAAAKGDPEGSAKGVSEGAAKGGTGAGAAGSPDGAQIALARRAYYTALWNAIRQHWTLPEALKAQKLEAVLVVVIRRDGKVLDVHFEKQSGQAMFDESVMRAVRKAEPLPPFPAIYSVAQEEVGLRFRPEDIS